MAEPTLTEVFGANATQDATTITITKSDLAAMGLTAAANNRAESIVVALLKLMSASLTEIARAQDIINRNVSVNYQGQDLVEQGSTSFRRDAYSVLLYKQTTLESVDPDDY